LRVLLVLPAALFMGAVGWSLVWIDSQNSSKKKKKAQTRVSTDADPGVIALVPGSSDSELELTEGS
jgi:lipid A disaccharide synthetase